MSEPFDEVDELLEKSFYNFDLQAVRIILGAAKSHYLDLGDPVWLFVVAPPDVGRSIIISVCGLPEVVTLDNLNGKTFLSYRYHEPGLLEKTGRTVRDGNRYTTHGNAIFLVKDFMTTLSRKEVLAQLRRVHDGEFERHDGSGITKSWKGKVTIIAAVTPALDRRRNLTILGGRFLQVRWHRPDSPEGWVQPAETREIIRDLFHRSTSETPKFDDQKIRRLGRIAEIVALGRAYVYRNSYTREIEDIAGPEAPYRIVKGLISVALGIASLSRRSEVNEQDLQDAFRMGLESLPEVRRKILVAAFTGASLNSLNVPRTTLERAGQDLKELGVLQTPFEPLKLTDSVHRLYETSEVKVVPGGKENE